MNRLRLTSYTFTAAGIILLALAGTGPWWAALALATAGIATGLLAGWDLRDHRGRRAA